MMRRYALLAAAFILASLTWAGLVFADLSEGWTRSAIAEPGNRSAFVASARKVAMKRNRGNLAFVLIVDGKEADSFFLSKGETVDRHSVFQVASLGKWLTAWGVMALVEEGRIDLYAPVSTYLTRWQLPASAFDASGVTVRRLLSHTSGLDDGLGYNGFDTKEQRQSLEGSLTRAGDAAPDKTGVVSLGHEPGSEWNYSGGGYTLLQLIIEEVSGEPFAQYMDRTVFTPLGMTRTTFDHDKAIGLGLAENFRSDGTSEPFRWYTALAATSLFTTPSDLSRFIRVQSPQGDQEVLSQRSLDLIATPHASQLGADIWGLGAVLYAPNDQAGFVVGHDGQNGPAINTAARLDPATGDGIVVLSTGNPGLATQLAGEWVFWKTGRIDTLDFAAAMPRALVRLVVGLAVILLLTIVLGFRLRRRALAKNPGS